MQCKRCQRFGHTKNQCFRPFRCVKCGNEHPTSSCTKTPDTDATCANCQEKHPASYKGCAKYKQYKDKILKTKLTSKENNPTRDTKATKTLDQTAKQKIRQINSTEKRSYAEATKNRPPMEELSNQRNLPDRLELMFAKFQQIMISMMDKMMDRMIQLVTSLVTK